ncbi:hypothetical protein [Maridesulfovibrio zosterae]|uniref:hypothetical protein n=1 Tax=Maridesulfovibrio zosterae TaxID=82171 RepID=UPI000403E975|nr:hypothetical protein [Maridesulfovibrio zosterae]
MSFFNFMKSFTKTKTRDAGKSIVQAIASWDPEAASAAEIEMMEERLDKLTQQVAEARSSYQKEQKEADEINSLFDQRMKAAELLSGKLADNPENAAEIEEALNLLVAEMEEMKPEIDREMMEAVEAKEFMGELEEVAKAAAGKLKTARQSLDKAKRDMERAKIKQERAQERAEQSAALAGLRNDSDNIGSALSAMQREAEEATIKADALSAKAKLLAPSPKEKGNSLISQAMSEVKGDAKPTNFADRLAALKK